MEAASNVSGGTGDRPLPAQHVPSEAMVIAEPTSRDAFVRLLVTRSSNNGPDEVSTSGSYSSSAAPISISRSGSLVQHGANCPAGPLLFLSRSIVHIPDPIEPNRRG